MKRSFLFAIAAESLTFLVAAMLHAGVPIPVISDLAGEPVIRDAVIVETLCGTALAISLWALVSRRSWTRKITISAHVFAICGVLLGMAALAHGLGPTTTLNYIYHRT